MTSAGPSPSSGGGAKRPREAVPLSPPSAQQQHKLAQTPATGGLTVLHRSRALPWRLAAVTCVAACPDGSVFAAGYDDGKVEVFDAALFNCLATIPGADGTEVTSVAWARAAGDAAWRLFASTLDGSLLELSCARLAPIASTDSFGGAIWCLRAAPAAGGLVTQLAAACDDGSVKLFTVSSGAAGVEYARALPRVEGNSLSLAWAPDGRRLVSGGSDGCIHVWDPAAGSEQQRITVGSSSTSPACVWALAVLRDGTIVSGDGEGAVQWWDARFGTLLARQQQFAADVMALAASPDGSCVWASGVDPRVAMFQLVPDKAAGASKWVYLDRKAPHTHDVRALGVLQRPDADPLLLSGGNDGQLVLYPLQRFLQEHPVRQSKSPQAPLLALSAGPQPALVLHVQGRELNLWRLGRAAARPLLDTGHVLLEGDAWDLADLPEQAARITTAGAAHAITAALAPDGSAVAAADRAALRLFRVAQPGQEGGGLAVRRVKVAPLEAPVVACAFSPDSRLLYAVTGAGQVLVVDAGSGEVTASAQLADAAAASAAQPRSAGKLQSPPSRQAAAAAARAGTSSQRPAGAGSELQQGPGSSSSSSWSLATAPYMPAASSIAVSPNGQVLAVATPSGVQLLAAPSLRARCRLLLLGEAAGITALAFSANSKLLAVATAANSLAAYSAESGLPTQWSAKHAGPLSELLQQLPGSIAGLSFRPTPSEPLGLLVYSPGGICVVDMASALAPPQQEAKQPRSKRRASSGSHGAPAAPDAGAAVGRNGRLLKLQHCCLLAGHLSGGEALLLEKPWADVLAQLTPPLYRHRYGT